MTEQQQFDVVHEMIGKYEECDTCQTYRDETDDCIAVDLCEDHASTENTQ